MDTQKQKPRRVNFSQLFGWIFAVLFVISMVGFIFTYFPTRKLLNPQYYKNTFTAIDFYQQLPRSIAQHLAVDLTDGGGGDDPAKKPATYLLILDQDQWETVIVNIVNPEWLQSQIELLIDQFFEILLRSPEPASTPLVISIQELKSRLAGPEGVQAFDQILTAQTPCTIDQLMSLLQLGIGINTSPNTLLCRPPDYILSELNPVVQGLLSAITAQLPDQISINLPLSSTKESGVEDGSNLSAVTIPKPYQIVRQVNRFSTLSPLLPLVMILMVTVFAVRSFEDLLRWWGWTFSIAGVISLIFSLLMFPITSWGFRRFLPSEFINSSEISSLIFQNGLGDFMEELLNELIISIAVPAGITLAIGLVLLLGLYLTTKQPAIGNGQEDRGSDI